ncbi:MAG: site-specific integrase [Clostridiales Family XIII bacterium]|jgi:integrase|nr:site-specific integrase [Clostridiales Family XIII bacterium]
MKAHKDKKGAYYVVVNYTANKGEYKQKKLSAKTSREVIKKAEEWKKQNLPSKKILTMNFKYYLMKIYLPYVKRLKKQTYRKKESVIKCHILPAFENYNIGEITPQLIIEWQNKLLLQNYSNTTLRKFHIEMSAIFNYAVKIFGLLDNPNRIAGAIGSQRKDKVKFWTLEEFNKFINSFDLSKDFSYYVLFNILFWTGIRIGEALALKVNKVDFVNKKIIIDETGGEKTGEYGTTKTEKSNRIISVDDDLIELIKKHISRIYQPKPEQRIFNFLRNAANEKRIYYIKKSGVKYIVNHEFRNSHACFLRKNKVDYLIIKERLGHKNIKTTIDTYSHIYPDEEKTVPNLIMEIKSKEQNN